MKETLEEARARYERAMERVRTTQEPVNQKFPIGTKVKIANEMPTSMKHFPHGVTATVAYTYLHAYNCGKADVYCLVMPDGHTVAWYPESLLTEVL